ncbi:LPXTG-motif cell wall-anchored protein [Cryobacterium mesophilum]|nr:LPXTG cell wall anchor domain-containing protein [Terrimesophilobacter mesophilus]MBB5633855.1 LPXTG-motif cell wall-anchored protein [Terrimesophilobacter mesophilus]
MRTSKFLSLAAASALLAGGSLLSAGPASASTTVDYATFYGASDFGVESGGYPTGVDWFFGDVSGTEGPHQFTNTGLVLNDPASGDVQILNQNVTTPVDAGELASVVQNANIFAQNGEWFFQLAFFAEGTSDTGFTTLRPATAGSVSTGDPWITSQALGSYAAGATASFSDLADALYAGEAPQLLAYGFFVAAGQTTTINGISWGTQGSSFGLPPTRTISPNPITQDAFSTAGQGLTLSGTNWFPGVDAYIFIVDHNGTTVFEDTSSFIVDSAGNVSVSVVLPSKPDVGTYYVTFDDDSFYYHTGVLDHYVSAPGGGEGEGSNAQGIQISVIAAAPELAATGAESGTLIAGGILLLILGGVVLIGSRRRRAQLG